ncbi:1,3-beta-galactosyl-N-acetylhexosamine phosphorylase N-terminal domain-containing protein, partial [Bifidobacterium bifidum]|uniref:1,3-beta-galactosyl-N-acetylhexosamine phosphorylase N-terminal domain-containing protein n=1 Tax=Bifidobacterium bifidum TaxID=1681 RepID=UPI000D563FDC
GSGARRGGYEPGPRITLHRDETPQGDLLAKRALAESDTVDGSLMDGFFEEQLKPNFDAAPHKYWEVVARSTGAEVPTEQWTVDAEAGVVHVSGAEQMHE